MRRKLLWRGYGAALLVCLMAGPALAQPGGGGGGGGGGDDGGGGGDGDGDEKSGPDMNAMASKFNATRVHKDFSYIRYRPAGDRVQVQPDLDRLLFWTKDGKPDGYAQRRGDSVIYYDSAGHASRVQHLEPGEGD
ncbi:hypothetical protein [Acetobacter oeni]|uniref:hypothetical protein n=1 Tax=Acetobacter oeni TaxID=304077 RepID=UPI001606448D|nr:hypothetical protein [Acetobacter oeni]MBB3884020.1 hypothetical protein [Acetobacter oeni]